MDDLMYWILGLGVTAIMTLIAVVYRGMVKTIDELKTQITDRLALKVNGIAYKVEKEWQQSLYADMRITIKELKDENNEAHRGILLELQRMVNK